ncbi:MAG TPA: ketoacyl-ACP synthase III [Clostridiaceae bacterium]|nr:ketoacyl-ACP synthase III [Clostridiaceae bacterium]
MGIKLVSATRYLPQGKLTNSDLEKMVETSDDWIRQRTGLVSRTMAGDETITDMAIKAARECLEKIDREIIDKIKLLIVTTASYLQVVPHVSAAIVKPIGLAEEVLAFDINSGCTSFIYALDIVEKYLLKDKDQYALIVSSDKLSDYIDYTDRGTCILFGDAAAATLWAYEEQNEQIAIHKTLTAPDVLFRDGDYINMNGNEVFKFAVGNLPELISDVCRKANVDVSEVDLFLLHQANGRIIESVAKKFRSDDNHFPVRFQNIGNTSSVSLPILITQMIDEDKLQNARNIIFAGFGAGLSLGVILFKGIN